MQSQLSVATEGHIQIVGVSPRLAEEWRGVQLGNHSEPQFLPLQYGGNTQHPAHLPHGVIGKITGHSASAKLGKWKQL